MEPTVICREAQIICFKRMITILVKFHVIKLYKITVNDLPYHQTSSLKIPEMFLVSGHGI